MISGKIQRRIIVGTSRGFRKYGCYAMELRFYIIFSEGPEADIVCETPNKDVLSVEDTFHLVDVT